MSEVLLHFKRHEIKTTGYAFMTEHLATFPTTTPLLPLACLTHFICLTSVASGNLSLYHELNL